MVLLESIWFHWEPSPPLPRLLWDIGSELPTIVAKVVRRFDALDMQIPCTSLRSTRIVNHKPLFHFSRYGRPLCPDKRSAWLWVCCWVFLLAPGGKLETSLGFRAALCLELGSSIARFHQDNTDQVSKSPYIVQAQVSKENM